MRTTISEFKHDEFFLNCKRGFLAIGTPKNESWNRDLYLKSECGNWEIADQKVKNGDALFWILPSREGNKNHRELHVGIVERVVPAPDHPGRYRIHVQNRFTQLGSVTNGVWNFLGVKSFPSKGLLQVWGKELNQSRRSNTQPNETGSDADDYLDIENSLRELDENAKNEVRREIWSRTSAHTKYRNHLLKYWQRRCALTGLGDAALLIASHIKPWSHCFDEEDKYKTDPCNGLLLIAPVDKLFDRGYISFSDDGVLQLHKSKSHRRYLSDETLSAFGLTRTIPIKLRKTLNEKHREFMQYHRDSIFNQ